MRRGDHAAAWDINDAVSASRDLTSRDDPALPYHQRWVWDNRTFHNRNVLIRCYHGLGDTLQYARYLLPLRQQAATVTVEAPRELISLLANCPGPDRIVPFIHDAPQPPSECDIEIMELPHALRLGPGAVRPPYLQAQPSPGLAGAIGVCWKAGDWNPERSVPPDLLAPLIAKHRVLMLQPSASDLPVLNPNGVSDIATLAQAIMALDVVITVDTMVAHLAGALGRPAWVMLKHDADWRWMEGRTDSPWYPSLKLYRQPAPGAWAPLIAAITDDLGGRVGLAGK